jgi:parvulin-like peptidyl-prolyl isomerase
MAVIESDARESSLMTETERRWLASYAVRFELVSRYVKREVDRRLAETDWDTEALEQYLAEPDAYALPERVSVRALLVSTENRSATDAMAEVEILRAVAMMPDEDFGQLVSDNTDDENAREKGGLMENLVRGQTVAPFESAAFALREPGEISAPVTTDFGIHLIQLVEYQPPRKRSFEDTKVQIIEELKPLRASQYRQAIQQEARERKPAGFVEHTDALDNLMLQTSDGPLGLQ